MNHREASHPKLHPMAVAQRRERRAQGERDTAPVDHCYRCHRPLPHTEPEQRTCDAMEPNGEKRPEDTSGRYARQLIALADAARVLAKHQLASVLPGGVACTCGEDLAALNAPVDDGSISGEPLALAVHQLRELGSARRAFSAVLDGEQR